VLTAGYGLAMNPRIALALALAACTSTADDTGADPGTDPGTDPTACHATPLPEDAVRKLVLSHPYGTPAGEYVGDYAVYSFDPSDASIAGPDERFAMLPGMGGVIAFTPDGQIGAVAQRDGTVGVFRFEADGSVTVVHESYGDGVFYTEEVLMDPSGSALWVVDGNWVENGGGIYRVDLACDGTLSSPRRVFTAKQPSGMSLSRAHPGQGFVSARALGDEPVGTNAFLLDLAQEQVLASVAAFPDDESFLSHAALSDDGLVGVVGDNNEFTSTPNRVARLAAGDGTLVSEGSIDVYDPTWFVPSPFDDGFLVASSYDDALVWLRRTSSGLEAGGKVASAPLPGGGVRLTRGVGRGAVLFAELTGVHVIKLSGGGQVTDGGAWSAGSGYSAMVGAIGLQP